MRVKGKGEDPVVGSVICTRLQRSLFIERLKMPRCEWKLHHNMPSDNDGHYLHFLTGHVESADLSLLFIRQWNSTDWCAVSLRGRSY